MRPMVARLDPDLASRLREVGIDPERLGDPAKAWRRLRERFGRRATLIDRYALEAVHRGVKPCELGRAVRDRVTVEVLEASFPGFEVLAESDRVSRDAIDVVPYDAVWPGQFATWRVRLAEALSATARRIDHVGSTSVPGLAAKPVIDVQVSVPDVEDESAYVTAIESVGVAFRSRDDAHRYFRPAGDRPRVVQIHVCPTGSAWERDHLLFRDFLRSHAESADAYGRLKCMLAAEYRDDRIAYNEAKTNFILDTADRAEAWATKTGWRVDSPRAINRRTSP